MEKSRGNLLDRRAALALLFILAVGTLLAENLLSFPLSLPYMTNLSGGAPILDTRLGYTAAAAYELFDALGQGGREAYLKLLWTVDLVLPLLFGLFLSALMRRGRFRRWSWFPLLASAFDYAENLSITYLLLRYPDQLPAVVHVASTFTTIKQSLYASSMVLSIAGLLRRPST